MDLNLRQFIAFSATREADVGRVPRLQPRRVIQAIRRSLVSASGLIYPNLQAPSLWTDVEDVDGTLYVTFNRRKPNGDLRVQPDGSYVSTRELLDDEAGPVIFLEALTWELTGNTMFFSNLTEELRTPGTYRISISLGGFDNAQVDWAGFQPTEDLKMLGYLLNWRFGSSIDTATFEASDVRFPCNSPSLVRQLHAKAVDVIGDLASNVVCLYRPPIGPTRKTRLELDESSILRVSKAARQRILASGGTQ